MRMEFDPGFVEKAVQAAARTDIMRERAMHARIDAVYAIADLDAREGTFRESFADLFAQWRLAQPIQELVNAYRFPADAIERCIVREANRRKSECAELLVRRSGGDAPVTGTLVLSICPESLFSPVPLREKMRRELMHVQDMLAPAFGYRPGDLAGGLPQQNLIRDRYRVLWDLIVEGRLSGPNNSLEDTRERFLPLLARAFARQIDQPLRAAIAHLLQTPGITHADLIKWSREPETLLTIAGGKPHPEVRHLNYSHPGAIGHPMPATA